MECKNPRERDEEGKLPYTADKLCAPDERKKINPMVQGDVYERFYSYRQYWASKCRGL
jgi:hypothetical protein